MERSQHHKLIERSKVKGPGPPPCLALSPFILQEQLQPIPWESVCSFSLYVRLLSLQTICKLNKQQKTC